MTLSEIRTLASVWLDDVNNGYFTTAQLNVWINNAQREVQKLLLTANEDFYTICASTSTVVNQARYAFPSDFLKLHRLSYISSGTGANAKYERIMPITRNEQDIMRMDSTGTPQFYYVNQNTFTLVPIPDRVWTMQIDYTYRVADLANDADVPDVPEDYHEYIAILTARDGFLRDGRDLTPIERKLSYFENMAKKTFESRKVDSPRMVVSTSGGFGGI